MSKTPREPVGSEQSHADNEREVREAIGGALAGSRREYDDLLALAEPGGTPHLNEVAARMFEHILRRLGPPA